MDAKKQIKNEVGIANKKITGVDMMWGKGRSMVVLRPAAATIDTYTPLGVYTDFSFSANTQTLNSATHEALVAARYDYMMAWWRAEARNWRETHRAEIRADRMRRKILSAAKAGGLREGKLGSDTFSMRIRDMITSKRDLRKYHACGNFLAVVEQSRTRTYAKSCKWRPSTRIDSFLVGINENGNPFAHQVATGINLVSGAWNWMWDYSDIVHRQGDIGLAVSSLKNVSGEESDIDVIGHSRHRFLGEHYYRNGSLHVRNGFLYHTGEQHPTINVTKNKWYRVVVAKRSQKGMSSWD